MNALTEKPTHIVHFRSYKTPDGYSQPESIRITQKQHDALISVLAKDKFVQIEGSTYSTSDIRAVEKLPEIKQVKLEPWNFLTDEDYQVYLKGN